MTCKDCIHSEVCYLRENVPSESYADKCGYSHFVQDLERPTGKWIPVSEGLPNDRDWYLGIFRETDTGWINPVPFICDYVGHITKGTTNEGWIIKGLTDPDNPHEYYKNLECVAWQPLPEPYKEAENETDN